MRRKYEEDGVFIVLLKWNAGLSHFTPPLPTPSEFRLDTRTVRWSPFLFRDLVGGRDWEALSRSPLLKGLKLNGIY